MALQDPELEAPSGCVPGLFLSACLSHRDTAEKSRQTLAGRKLCLDNAAVEAAATNAAAEHEQACDNREARSATPEPETCARYANVYMQIACPCLFVYEGS